MKRKAIKNTDLMPSEICLGGGPLCDLKREKECFALMDYFFDMGGNFIDTANIYGKWLPGGVSTSEMMLGAWMKSRKNAAQMVISTKGAHPQLDTMHIQRLSKEELQADVEESLKSMQVEEIDLYWLHRDDTARPAEEIIISLNDLVKQGKLRYFGVSNWTAARIKEANAYAAKSGLQGFVANQPLWSLATVDMDFFSDKTLVNMDECMLQLHKDTGMAAVPYSAQAGGYFQKLADGAPIPEQLKAYHHRANMERLPIIQNLAEENGKSVNQISLAYLLNQPFTTIPIVGCATVEKLQESLGACGVELSDEQMKAIDNN